MSVRQIQSATTNVSINLRIIDSTDGTPETGVVWNSAGIDLWYRREGAVSVDITEATLAALTTAHTDGGFLHINDGVYRLDLPDAACATGVTGVQIGGTVTGMVVLVPYIELVDYDPYDVVRLGLTALANAAADGVGGLPISDAGGLDLDAMNTNINDIETDTTDIQSRIPAALVGGAIDADVSAIQNDAITAAAIAANAIGSSELAGSAITSTVLANNAITGDKIAAGAIGTTEINDGAITAAKFAAGAIDAAAIATDAIGSAELATTAVDEIADALWDEAKAGHVAAGSFGEEVQAHALSTEITALNDVSTAEVNAEVDTALADANLDHLAGTAAAIPAIPAGTYIDQMMDDGTATFDRTTDSLQAVRDRGDAAWTTGAGTGLTALASGTAQGGTASTIQLASGETFANSELNGNSVKITGGTGAGQSRLITAYTGATDTATIAPNWTTNPDATSVYEIVDSSVNVVQVEGSDATDQIRDAVVDDATRIDASALNTLSGNDPGSQLAAQSDVTGLNDPTAATIADAVWDEASTGHVDAGKAGQQLWTDIDAILADTNELQTDDIPTSIAALPTAVENRQEIDSNSTQLTAIVADTNELQTDWANGGRLDLLIDSIITATVGTIAEITGAADIPTTPTIKQAIMLRYQMDRNAGQSTASERRVMNNAGTEVLDAVMSDDATTFDQGLLGAP